MTEINYEQKLIEWSDWVIGKPYIWGETDCGTLVRKGLTIMLGKDPFGAMPWWKDETEMRSLWYAMGGPDEAFEKVFGAGKISPGYIRTGDVALLTIKESHTAVLVINNKMMFSSTDGGVHLREIRHMEKLNFRFFRFTK